MIQHGKKKATKHPENDERKLELDTKADTLGDVQVNPVPDSKHPFQLSESFRPEMFSSDQHC